MTDTTAGDAPQNGSGNGGASEAPMGPQFRVLAQYIKDLSFENPNAPNSLMAQGQQPKINLSVDVQARRGQQDRYEVDLRFSISAQNADEATFIAELVYSGLFIIQNVPETDIQPFLFIECPRFLFPFARRIIAECTAEGGFPPLLIDPIDFASLMRRRLEAQNQSAGNPDPAGTGEPQL